METGSANSYKNVMIGDADIVSGTERRLRRNNCYGMV
jgi:hypothetical protein